MRLPVLAQVQSSIRSGQIRAQPNVCVTQIHEQKHLKKDLTSFARTAGALFKACADLPNVFQFQPDQIE